MKHRTQDHLFAAAGVTAALSLIGTGATVLKGSVFHFDHWPLVASGQARDVQLPTAPQVPAPVTQTAGSSLLSGATRVGGNAALLPGLGGPTGIAAIGLTVPAGATPAGTTGTSGVSGTRGTAPASAVVGATRDGSSYALGAAPSGSVDGTRDPVSSTGETDTSSSSGTRVAAGAGVDTDGDGVPDAWESDHGAPITPDAPAATGNATDRRSPTSPSSFTADQPEPEATPAPAPADTPATPPPATDPVPTDPAPSTDPPPGTDPVPADPAPSTDPAPADPAPSSDPAPSTDPAPADPATPAPPAPADPAPADPPPSSDPAPADPTPPADPAPAPDSTAPTGSATSTTTAASTATPAAATAGIPAAAR
jgi:hypothetical protein